MEESLSLVYSAFPRFLVTFRLPGVFKGLKEGKYRITEVQSPKGYSLLANPIEVTLPYVTSGNAGVETNGKPVKVGDTDYYYYDLTYTVKNNKLFDMPEAGGG